jgi:hypothetical protein
MIRLPSMTLLFSRFKSGTFSIERNIKRHISHVRLPRRARCVPLGDDLAITPDIPGKTYTCVEHINSIMTTPCSDLFPEPSIEITSIIQNPFPLTHELTRDRLHILGDDLSALLCQRSRSIPVWRFLASMSRPRKSFPF